MPERVVLLLAVWDCSDQVHAVVVDRVALENRPVEVEGSTKTIIGFVYCGIAGRPLSFRAHQCAGQSGPMIGRVDHALLVWRGDRRCGCGRGYQLSAHARTADRLVSRQRPQRPGPLLLIAVHGNSFEDMWWDDSADCMPITSRLHCRLHFVHSVALPS